MGSVMTLDVITSRSRSASYSVVVMGRGMAAIAAARESVQCGGRVVLLAPGGPTAGPTSDRSADGAAYTQAIRECQARRGLRPLSLPVDEPCIDVLYGHERLQFWRYRTVLAGDVEVRFRRAVIATGSLPGAMEVVGADKAAALGPGDLDRLEAAPSRLAVLGSDGEACFWAQQLRRLGSEVHLIAVESRLLEDMDRQAAGIVVEQLQAEGVRVHAGCDEVRLDRTGYRRGVQFRQNGQRGKLLVDEVLVCASPRPNLGGLALETAGVRYGRRGIAVDDRLGTSDRHVYAAGGACGADLASPEAELGTGRLAARNAAAWLPRRLATCVIPRYTPTDPPVVELRTHASRKAAPQRTIERRIEFDEPPTGRWGGAGRGCIAIRMDHRQRLLLATIAAAGAEDLALPLMLLMHRRLPITTLRELATCRSTRGALLLPLAR